MSNSHEKVRQLTELLLESEVAEQSQAMKRSWLAKTLNTKVEWPNSTNSAQNRFFNSETSIAALRFHRVRYFGLQYGNFTPLVMKINPNTGSIEYVSRAFSNEAQRAALGAYVVFPIAESDTHLSGVSQPTEVDYDLVISELELVRGTPEIAHGF